MSSRDPVQPQADDPAAPARRGSLGLWLFTIYLLAYVGYVILCAFAGNLIGRVVLAGVNLAIVYGIGLILGAMILALAYMVLGDNPADQGPTGEEP